MNTQDIEVLHPPVRCYGQAEILLFKIPTKNIFSGLFRIFIFYKSNACDKLFYSRTHFCMMLLLLAVKWLWCLVFFCELFIKQADPELKYLNYEYKNKQN
jgi:hypothetical protein